MSDIKKKSGSYNEYTLSLSYGQLECLKSILARDHADPMADELYGLFVWALDGEGQLDKPGEDKAKEEKEAKDEVLPDKDEAESDFPEAPGGDIGEPEAPAKEPESPAAPAAPEGGGGEEELPEPPAERPEI